MKGYIVVYVEDVTTNGVTSRKITYYPAITDGVHGINISINSWPDGTKYSGINTHGIGIQNELITSDDLKRGDIVMSGIYYINENEMSAHNFEKYRCIES